MDAKVRKYRKPSKTAAHHTQSEDALLSQDVSPTLMRQALQNPHTTPLTPNLVLQLQATHGNHFVQGLVQRAALNGKIQRQDEAVLDEAVPDVEEVEEPILTPGQVAKARSYYAKRRRQYTPEIIAQIQAQVDVEPTGVIDEATIQAVARFQQANPPLAVDGMAGPRTLPAAFPSGLAEAERMDTYVEEAQGVEAEWATLGTAQARADALMEAVNGHLSDSGVPECSSQLADLDSNGQLDFENWRIELGQERFGRETVSSEEAAGIARTVYHEARHAEQWFRMAQMRAGQGRTAAQIAREMSIPPEIAQAAVADPIQPGTMEALIADGWFQSVYGSGSDHRDRTLREVDRAATALEEAQQAHDDNPTPATEARLTRAQDRFERAFEAYHNLPEEADAHRVGDAIMERYTTDEGG